MRISYNWIKQFLKIDWKSDEIAALLTDLGLEVEGVEPFESIKGGLKGVVIGEVLTCIQHPNADRLRVTTVAVGDEKPLQIVCGAPNVVAGQKVLVATMGTKLFDKEGNEFEIKKGKIRGEDSFGMICAEDELGLGESHEGIMVLPADSKVGTLASAYFNIETDEVFEIGLTPNRADAMSHYGVARDLKAGLIQTNYQHSELMTPSVSKFKVDKKTLKIDIKVEDSKLIPRYCGVTLSNVTVKNSPNWLQNRLKAIGIQPKNNIVDVTNYVMHDLGQPLHAFDASKIKGNKIIVKTAESGSKLVTLDDAERTLHTDDIVICDEQNPLCVGGVFGGKTSGVTQETTTIFLESAYFNPVSIRKTAKRHGLNTDASFRFERGIDPDITKYALKRAALLIQEVSGAEITSEIIDIYPKEIEPFSVFLSYENLNRTIGEEIKRENVKNILASLDIKITNSTEKGLGLQIPSYRVDVQREIDVIEDILRVYGYNNIGFSTKINASVANSPRTTDYKVQNIIAEQLVSQGFIEIMANSLTTSYIKYSDELKEEENVQILNPLSADLAVMRQSMLFSGLEAIQYNSNRKRSDLKLFEFGKTYHKKEGNYIENKHLALFFTGFQTKESWANPQKPTNFFVAKGYIKSIFERIGLQNITTLPCSTSVFQEGIGFAINNTIFAELGILKKTITKDFDCKNDVFYADIDWSFVLSQLSTKIKFAEISKFPEVRRDLALLLDKNVPFEQIYNVSKQTEKKLVKEINLFDVYEGKNLPENKKSYAISYVLQDQDKTLTDAQIEKIMSKILTNLQTEVGAVLR